MNSNPDDAATNDFDEALARSSLGSRGARELRSRTSTESSYKARRLGELHEAEATSMTEEATARTGGDRALARELVRTVFREAANRWDFFKTLSSEDQKDWLWLTFRRSMSQSDTHTRGSKSRLRHDHIRSLFGLTEDEARVISAFRAAGSVEGAALRASLAEPELRALLDAAHKKIDMIFTEEHDPTHLDNK
jgi:hypothetical protein